MDYQICYVSTSLYNTQLKKFSKNQAGHYWNPTFKT